MRFSSIGVRKRMIPFGKVSESYPNCLILSFICLSEHRPSFNRCACFTTFNNITQNITLSVHPKPNHVQRCDAYGARSAKIAVIIVMRVSENIVVAYGAPMVWTVS
uniref:Uncharacterized protein n=1 Tax=viral metagenome TaxID=1070528 RepID=A0A6C0F3X8_9ZZZZ